MSRLTRAAAVVGLLVLAAGFGLVAVSATPPGGRGVGIWPAALTTAAIVLGGRRRAPVLALVTAGLAIGTVWLGGHPGPVAVGYGAGLALQSVTTWWLLTRGRTRRPRLRTVGDLSSFLLAVLVGALVVGVVSALTSLATDWGSPGLVALTIGTAGAASHLTLLPFCCRFSRHRPLASPVERGAQWSLLLAVSVAVLMPNDFPSLIMLVLPILAWGALRNGSYESLAQMAVTVAIAIPITTAGTGPFARPDLRFDVPADLQGILLSGYGIVCDLMVLALVIVVGEMREHARQAAAERELVRHVVDGITSVAIIGADLEGRVTIFNPGAQRLLGYDADDVLGRPSRVLHSDAAVAAKAAELGLPADFSAVARELMGAGTTEMGFLRADGQERMHAMSLQRVLDETGAVIGYVSTSEDVTERLQAEARLVDALETEREAVERLREVDRVKDAFVSSVSHELRTPITSILGYTELLEGGDLGELTDVQQDAVARIGGNGQRLLTLISELLTLSRIEDDGLASLDQDVDLVAVVGDGVAVLSPTLAGRQVDLHVDLPATPLVVRGDPDMLERVVINLVDNAHKFTPDGGRVDVRLRRDLDAAVLEVVDTGMGVPANEQPRLFERFYRSSLAVHHAVPGSGLGLSITRSIVQRHGGTLDLHSETGRGSTFRVRVPLTAAEGS